jgi:hypothetical protein
LFSCSTNRKASFESVLSRSELSTAWDWNISFVRDFNDWELPVIMSFFTWKLRSSGKFDVRSFYCALHSSHRTLFLWKLIWGVKAPRRISFFLWTTARGSILTCDNLMRRGHVLAGWCCMCKNHWETGDHLLLHCEAAVGMWSFVLNMFGIQWVLPTKVLDLLLGWYNWFGRHSSTVWNLVPHCLMWSVWQERNRRIFEDSEKSSSSLQEQFSGLLFDCSRTWGFTEASSLPDFVASLNVV